MLGQYDQRSLGIAPFRGCIPALNKMRESIDVAIDGAGPIF